MTIDEAVELFQGITYGVSKVSDGNMSFKWGEQAEVIKNREAFLRDKGVSLSSCVVTQPQHEDVILIVDGSAKGRGASTPGEGILAEAVITKERGMVLFLLTADCLPIAYYDPKNEVVALAHLGWKPTEKRLAEKVVEKMTETFGTAPCDLIVFIGPGIHKESYVLPNPQQKQSEEWRPFLEETPTGETRIDLIGFNTDQLLRAGVLAERIAVSHDDTEQSPRFFSHYRSVRTGEPEGRFATIIGLN